MKLVVLGVGKMGAQIAQKLAEAGFDIGVMNRSPEPAQQLAERFENITYLNEYDSLMDYFGDQQAAVWMMVPAGAVETVINSLTKNLSPGSIIIDGGNSKFTQTLERAERLSKLGFEYVDVGTSGGIHGLAEGFSMMAGGCVHSIDTLEPALTALAAPRGGFKRFGEAGAGHYVKMIHNGVEYGIMQAYAEGYHLLKDGPIKDIDLADVAEVWQQGSINESFLNDLSLQMLKEDADFTNVEGVVAESGEARWTLETAKEADIPTPVIQTAFDVRIASQSGQINYATKFLARLRNMFGGHSINIRKQDEKQK